ncbi:uncharacterized protein LOC135076711 [Ostrinia nubilalis]|uniref:uncharacterized protein LOC135076711 n=1 Tax=Ostrinia nubilalis TaxID=29057 RepID=UPI00308221FB
MWKPIILDVECIVCNKSLQKINHDPPEVPRKMGKITCRRSRTPNWSADEKKYLLELIKERKEVVVTKNNNGPNYSEEKDVAWNEILRELCLKFGNKFSGSSTKKVKTQWQNMKRIAREEISLVGPDTSKYTRQSLEVCTILDLIKDGMIKRDDENLNDTLMTANIEIKTERIDEDLNEPCCIGVTNPVKEPPPTIQSNAPPAAITRPPPSESSSASDVIEFEPPAPQPVTINVEEPSKKNAANMTEPCVEGMGNPGLLQRQLQEFFRYSSDEKQLKMESLKEERRVVKVMRETAELNKIIAEQKLKHVLWVKKQEMT